MRICRFFFRGFWKFKFCKNFFYFLYIHLPLLGSFEVTQNKLSPIDSAVKFRFSPPQLGYMIPLFQFSRAVFQLKCFCFEIRLSCFVVYLSIYLSIQCLLELYVGPTILVNRSLQASVSLIPIQYQISPLGVSVSFKFRSVSCQFSFKFIIILIYQTKL